MRYEKLTWYLDYLFPKEFWWVVALALVGAVIGLVRRDRAVLTILTLTVAFAVVFRVWPELHAWNLRFLPFWYLGLFLLAAVGSPRSCGASRSRWGSSGWGPRPRSVTTGHSTRRRRSSVPAGEERRRRLARRDHRRRGPRLRPDHAYERVPRLLGRVELLGLPGHVGLEHEAEAVRRVPRPDDHDGAAPPGRAMWEGGQAIDTYGTSLALMLLRTGPNGRIASMEGPLLRVRGDDAVPLHGGRSALGARQRVEPGARARLPHDRRLRPRRPLPAAARRPLLHGVLDRGQGPRRREPRTCSWSRRCATATTRHLSAGTSTR